MPQYDSISRIYDTYRSREIGVATITSYARNLGLKIAVLDMGCGTGNPIARELAPRVAHYVGIDISPRMAELFRKAVPAAVCVTSDLATMSLGDMQFDLCFSWGSICHLLPDQQRSALAIAASHTHTQGMIVFTGGPDRGECSGSVGCHRIQHYSLGAESYDALLKDLGFTPEFKGDVEGSAFLYAYKKNAQQVAAADAAPRPN